MREGAASTLSTSTPRVLVCSLAWELLPGETGPSCVSGGEPGRRICSWGVGLRAESCGGRALPSPLCTWVFSLEVQGEVGLQGSRGPGSLYAVPCV